MLHLFINITIVVDFFGNVMLNKPQNYVRMEYFVKLASVTPNFQLGIRQGPILRPFPGSEILVTKVDRCRRRLALHHWGGPCLI
jgi:hypothetical protein